MTGQDEQRAALLADAHARWHDMAGNMMWENADCGYERCEFVSQGRAVLAALASSGRVPDTDEAATRAFVSRQWAEDWNSPEDAVYGEDALDRAHEVATAALEESFAHDSHPESDDGNCYQCIYGAEAVVAALAAASAGPGDSTPDCPRCARRAEFQRLSAQVSDDKDWFEESCTQKRRGDDALRRLADAEAAIAKVRALCGDEGHHLRSGVMGMVRLKDLRAALSGLPAPDPKEK